MRKPTPKRNRSSQHRAYAFECDFKDKTLVESGVAILRKDGLRSVKRGLVLPPSPRKRRPIAQPGFQAPVRSDEGITQVEQEPVATKEDALMVMSISLIRCGTN